MADSREVMNIRQASQYLGVSPDTLYKYVDEQKIPAFKLGNRWRFKKSKLDQWMEEKSNQMEVEEQEESEGGRSRLPDTVKAGTCLDSDRRSIVGLDVGSSSIKAVELKKKARRH